MSNVRFHEENRVNVVSVSSMPSVSVPIVDLPVPQPQSPPTPYMQRKVGIWKVTCAHLLLVAAICVIVPTVFKSFHVVTYDKVAFKRNVYGSVDTSRVYTNGRYFLPLTQSFVEFDNTLEPIAFLSNPLNLPDTHANNAPLSVALSNGVQISIELLFQYQVDHARLATLYTQYSTSYLSQIIAVSTAAIKTGVIGFTQTDYVYKRPLVESTLANAVASALDMQLYVFAPRDKFKLLAVHFSDSVVGTNLQAVVSVQRNQVALLQQQVTAIESETLRQVAAIIAQQNQTLAQATIDSTRAVAFAQNMADNVVIGARALGQAAFFSTLGITNQTTQLALLRILDIIDTSGSVTLIHGSTSTQTPIILQL